jgi:hypothetical protein
MTAARTARRTQRHPSRTPLIRSATTRCVPLPLTLGSQQPPATASTALSARPAVLQRPAARRCHPILFPSAPFQRRLLRPNPHRACRNRRCPLSAISCLGASRTPAVGARRWRRHAGVRETCTGADVQTRHRNGSAQGSRRSRPQGTAVVGAGILGGMIGSATAPAPPQQPIIIVMPSVPAPPPPPPRPTPITPARVTFSCTWHRFRENLLQLAD